MDLLRKMESELSQLWTRAVKANNTAIRNKLMTEYREGYRKYKKQIRFIDAMSDRLSNDQSKQQVQ